MICRRLAFAVWAVLIAALSGMPAGAVEPPPGTTNFTAPGYVPDYFSNESGPFHTSANTPAVQAATAPAYAAPRAQSAEAGSRRARHHYAEWARAHGRHVYAVRRAAYRHMIHSHIAKRGTLWKAYAAHAHRQVVHGRRPFAGRRALIARGHSAPARARRLARAGG